MDFGALLKTPLPKFVLIVGQRESLPENREEKEPPSSLLSASWERFNSVGCLAWRRLLVGPLVPWHHCRKVIEV